jgi:asparagine synthase (glutamine-hydrolysing)
MCGITGLYNFKKDARVREPDVVAMRDTLTHRGPDSEGVYLSPDRRVGLGHRRLSIIDLSSQASQPMANEDDTVRVVFNGEIYNFKALREELIAKGHTFHSKSDTEVIVHGYEEYGFDCVKKFNGMFAFALWDEKKQLLFAARDHLGIKPLYYAVRDGGFYFGSEIKAILRHPDFKKELEERHISYYLTFACMPAPHTLFKDVQKLPAAHYVVVTRDGVAKTHEYWNPISDGSYTNESYDEEFYVGETRRLLEDSIDSQMVSDVPFGCFLSGGIDSSTNAALMSRALGSPVETFSIGVEDYQKYNEFQYSRATAKLLGARSHETVVGRKDLLEFLPQYALHADDPNGDQICFLVYYLSKLTRDNGVIVAQVGEGADEIFAGYGTYLRALRLHDNIWRHAEKFPAFLRAIPSAIGSRVLSNPRFDFPNSYLHRLAKGQEAYWGNAIAFSDYQKEQLLTPEYAERTRDISAYARIKECYDAVDHRDPQADFLKRMTYLELKIRLSELLLMRVDKMGMAHSLEARVPFLDHRLVELALRMPQDLKFKGDVTKYVLKTAVRGVIPDDIIDRKKQGFGAPISEWLRGKDTSKEFIDIIMKSKLRDRGILNYDYIEKLIAAHQRGRVDHNFRIWNLVTLSVWHDYWFGYTRCSSF